MREENIKERVLVLLSQHFLSLYQSPGTVYGAFRGKEAQGLARKSS